MKIRRYTHEITSHIPLLLSVICQINCVGGITWPTRMLKVFLGAVNDTCVIHFLYARALAWTKKKLKKSVHLEMIKLKANRTSETEEQR